MDSSQLVSFNIIFVYTVFVLLINTIMYSYGFSWKGGSTSFRNAILLATPIIEYIQASSFSGSGKYSGWGFCEEPVSKDRVALEQPRQNL